ncbi:hypothetical protein A2U01_0060280, partial [Trifolium medium]|nr:hypothetical protein [Trifolium medium]
PDKVKGELSQAHKPDKDIDELSQALKPDKGEDHLSQARKPDKDKSGKTDRRRLMSRTKIDCLQVYESGKDKDTLSQACEPGND